MDKQTKNLLIGFFTVVTLATIFLTFNYLNSKNNIEIECSNFSEVGTKDFDRCVNNKMNKLSFTNRFNYR